MRHPQDDLLIAYTLLRFAHNLEKNCDIEDPMEEHARDLAGKIVNQHGLALMDLTQQLKLRREAHCWDEDCN